MQVKKMNGFEKLYYSLNKNAVNSGMKYIRRLSVRRFKDEYIKSISSKGGEFQLLFENRECLDILSFRRNKKYLLRYHKCPMVFYEDYEDLLSKALLFKVDKLIYITCGRFEYKIYKRSKGHLLAHDCRISVIDGFRFTIKNLGIKKGWQDISYKHKKLYKYSP